MSEKAQAKVEYVGNGGIVDGPAKAIGIKVTDQTTGESVNFILGDSTVLRMFTVFGAFTIAQQTMKKSHAPIAEWSARYRKIMTSTGIDDSTWGDEKPVKAPKVPKDPLAELVDVIKAVKASLNLLFDEAATRAKLADPAFRRAAKKEPHVAAEFARRKSATAVASTDSIAAL